MKKIAIIGATGMLGQPVTTELLNAGYDITVLARTPEKAQKIWGDRVQIVKGDLKNEADINRLLQGQKGLYISLSVAQDAGKKDFLPERDGMPSILQAAKKAGIQRIGYLSSLVQRYQGTNGFDWWIFELKNQALEKVKKSGVPYTIFYPSNFMENFDKGGYKQGNKILLAGKSLHSMHYIAGADYGKQVAVAFQNDTTENKEYAVQGLEAFTADEAAAIYVQHYSKTKLSISKASVGLLKFLGNFSRKMNYGAHIVESLNQYPERFEAENTWTDLGKPNITLTEYAKNAT